MSYYCFFCGKPIFEGDKYCGYCGRAVSIDKMDQINNPKKKTRPRGIIFTDTIKLAHQFKVPRFLVLNTIEKYIEDIAPFFSYSLFDVANDFHKGTTHRRNAFNYQEYNNNGWRTYHHFLFKDKYLSFQFQPEYLFIIGSEDIIPVPMMKNCMPNSVRELVPTDILYGFNVSLFSPAEVDINSLISSKQFYYVGRLPLGQDATFDQLQNYLDRASGYMENGIPVQIAYAQSDPHWKTVSTKVMSDVNRLGLLPNIQAPSSILHENVFLSPYVTCETIDKAFNTYSNLYYFNMHGSRNPDKPEFLGEAMEDRMFYEGIDPKTISSAKYDNIVVTEACFGGKYIGLPTNGSMLLSSMSNSTMLYLGSSVTAYGTIDRTLKDGANISSADIIAKEFILGLMEGYCAGEAVFKARRTLYKNNNGGIISNLLTIYEFSLYGDPALKALFPNQHGTVPLSHEGLSDGFDNKSLRIEEVYSEHPSSILAMVRNKVDSSLQSLNEDIQRNLTQMGIKPRTLLNISKMVFGPCSQHIFTYVTDTGEEPIVVVDNRSHAKTLLMPKGIDEQSFNDARRLSIDYASIFRSFSQRFGLIPVNDDEQPVLQGNSGQIKTVYIDKRIEPRSKRQIKTFNSVLDQVYRPEMRNGNIASLAMKDCDYDFSLLINPLSIILETELRLGLKNLIKKEGSGWPSEPTLGCLTRSLMDNKQLLSRHGINEEFLHWISDVPDYRNQASHCGGVTESRFLSFYDLFIKIVSSPGFKKVLELKQNYK